MKIFVGASSSENIPNEYISDCKIVLEELLRTNDLVFGAYNKGLMMTSYEIAKKNNRQITGICSTFCEDSLKFLECNNHKVTNSIIDSTLEIYKNSDVMILLPGGFGSIFEFFTANYLKICNEINIPIIVYNSCGYYDKLLSFISDAYDKKFIKDNEIGKYLVANNIDEIMLFIKEIEKSIS